MKNTVPPPPKNISASTVLERMVDAIAIRFDLATRGLQDAQLDFRPVDSSMSIGEVIAHIHSLVDWTIKCFDKNAKRQKPYPTVVSYRIAIKEVCEELKSNLRKLEDKDLAEISVYLKRTDTHYPFWNLINGPIADALTHVGQINSWRRIAGNPCPKISPFTGEHY